MLKQAALIALASFIFFWACRYLIFKHPITAEDANKILVLIILVALGVLLIFCS